MRVVLGWTLLILVFAFLFLCVSVRYGLVNGAIVFSIAFGLTFLIVLAADLISGW